MNSALSIRPFAPLFLFSLSLTFPVACGGGDDEGYGYYGESADHSAPSISMEREEVQVGELIENDFVETSDETTSTFSIDVDTASYTVMRRSIMEQGSLPSADLVRTEEFINFFDYDYPEPSGEAPFSISMEVAPSHFGQGKHLMRVGLRGKTIHSEDIKPTNLVFLIDVSGSMSSGDKLGLVKTSLSTLVDHLAPTDTVGIVVYAGSSGTVLEPTPAREKAKIKRAVEKLSAGGGTNGEAGIVGAYALAESAKIEGGNNRVILLTDGDFNIGRSGDDLYSLIDTYREKEISLTCMGFGLSFNDYLMEEISNRGNGNYFYVDSQAEAERLFGSELASTLEVIAADVKIQVEFDPSAVARYRLVGYENRVLDNEDFEDDAVDAGEIGPGHTVTAYYELELLDQASETALLSTVRLRYKSQYGEGSKALERDLKLNGVVESFDGASEGFRFGAAVVEFAEILRGSKHVEIPDISAVERVARESATVGDAKRAEFIEILAKAAGMM